MECLEGSTTATHFETSLKPYWLVKRGRTLESSTHDFYFAAVTQMYTEMHHKDDET